MRQFKASYDEVKKMVILAINASEPVGLGCLHFEAKDYVIEDVAFKEPYQVMEIYIDYFQSRMVKFRVKSLNEARDEWECDETINPEYQSWSEKYPSYEALLNAVRQING